MTFATPPGPAGRPGRPGQLSRLGQLGLGAANLHVRGLEVAFDVLDAWVAAGGRLIDTAASYGAGESERALGAWLRERDTRDALVLLTKAGHPDPGYRHDRVTPEILESDLAGSLLRLGVPSVDILLVHRDDVTVPVEVILETLAAQVAAGRARAYGVSNWTLPRLDEALAYVEGHGLPPLAWSSSYLGLAAPVEPAWPGSSTRTTTPRAPGTPPSPYASLPGRRSRTASSPRRRIWPRDASMPIARPPIWRDVNGRRISPHDAG